MKLHNELYRSLSPVIAEKVNEHVADAVKLHKTKRLTKRNAYDIMVQISTLVTLLEDTEGRNNDKPIPASR